MKFEQVKKIEGMKIEVPLNLDPAILTRPNPLFAALAGPGPQKNIHETDIHMTNGYGDPSVWTFRTERAIEWAWSNLGARGEVLLQEGRLGLRAFFSHVDHERRHLDRVPDGWCVEQQT